MSNLSFPPPITDPRFNDWMQLLYKQVKNNSVSTTPSTTPSSLLPVQFGGTGAVTLSGYIKGNGTSPFTTVSTIPYSDISDAPTSSLGANLQALDITTGTGIYSITGAGTSAVRTMTGTSNRITVADGDGVSANPTFDISAAYVGQTSITTLGTITTGTWTGTSIGTAYTDAKVVSISGTSNRVTVAGTATVPVIDVSSSYPSNAGILATGNVTTTAVGNVGGGTDDLITFTLPANTLSANGKGVRITQWGTSANNINSKTLTTNFGGTTILTKALTISVATIWRIETIIFRTGSNAQTYYSRLTNFDTTGLVDLDTTATQGTATETDTATIIIKCTGTATADNDLLQKGALVEIIN